MRRLIVSQSFEGGGTSKEADLRGQKGFTRQSKFLELLRKPLTCKNRLGIRKGV